MEKVIARKFAKSCSVPDVLQAINDLAELAPVGILEVNLRTGDFMGADIDAMSLVEVTLSDGSKVYNIQLL